METTQILKEAKNQKDDYKIESFEELKSAIESKKLLKEIAGMQFNRWAGIITSLTALISVIVIISQSGVNNTKSYKDALDLRIINLNKELQDSEDKRDKFKINEIKIKNSINALNIEVEDKKKEREGLAKEVNTIKDEIIKIDNDKATLSNDLATISMELNTLENKKKYNNNTKDLASDKAKLENKLQQINESFEKLTLKYTKLEDAESKQQLSAQINADELIPFNKLKESTGLVSPEWQKMALTRKGTGKEIGGYTIKLTNVGNIKNNMDLKISLKDSSSGINYFNLDQGNTVVLRFNEAIFFIKIKKAEQSKIRAEEEGTIEVLLFKGGKNDKGDKGIRYRIVS